MIYNMFTKILALSKGDVTMVEKDNAVKALPEAGDLVELLPEYRDALKCECGNITFKVLVRCFVELAIECTKCGKKDAIDWHGTRKLTPTV